LMSVFDRVYSELDELLRMTSYPDRKLLIKRKMNDEAIRF